MISSAIGFILVVAVLLIILFHTWYYIWRITLGLILLIILLLLCGDVAEAKECTPTEIVKIGMVVQHEAGNQSELGKRLVADTILNRVESPDFPNTVEEVLRQPGQYCNPSKYPPNDIYRIVAEEIYSRTNSRVLWYRTKTYHTYGTPILVEGNHYFSGR